MNSADQRVESGQPTFSPFVQGLLSAVALGSLTSTGGGSAPGVVSVAIGMGIAAAVFAVAGRWLAGLAGWLYSVLGIVAFIPAAVMFVRSNGCQQGPPPALRFAAVALLALIALAMFAASFLTVRRMPVTSAGLALFGALQVLIAAATFIAGKDTSLNGLALIVMIPGAAVLGWCVVKFSDAVVGVAGVALGMQSIYGAAVDPACTDANFSGVIMIVVFTGAYFATRAVCAPFAGRR